MSLTPTQRFILKAAYDAGGFFVTAAGDRKGTRISRFDSLGHPVIIAYQTPEYFLKSRGLIEVHGNERHKYRLTDEGIRLAENMRTSP